MGIHVSVQMASLGELLSATFERALVWPFLGVDAEVLNELFEVCHYHTAAESNVRFVLALKDLQRNRLGPRREDVRYELLRVWHEIRVPEESKIEILTVDDSDFIVLIESVVFNEFKREYFLNDVDG